jgi:hypothetical protein
LATFFDLHQKLLLFFFANSYQFQPDKQYTSSLDYGCDLRVVLGLIQDHTGLLFCSNIFYEMVNLEREENEKKKKEFLE